MPNTSKSFNKPHKQIGVAVIRNAAGYILIDKRKAQGLMGSLWEFPGGKVEPNETVEDCIRREIKEELGINIAVKERLITIEHDYEKFKVTLFVHNCLHLSGEPQPLECDEIAWVTAACLDNYNFPAANQSIISTLQEIA